MRAISLFSGGLDSQLAVALIKEQGIEVIALTFITPFFGSSERTRRAAEDLGVKFHTMEVSHEYMDILRNPVYGYGKNFNPCIDCHAFMLRKAGDYMRETGASFIITGEVMGQRPMSQNKSALNAVNKLSGLKGLILRPLSALLLPPTLPEEEGWVDRSKLLDISGRSRTRQMELAEHYGIKDYPSPAGGCLLTQENFSRRLRSLWEVKPQAGADEMEILKLGRHFYLDGNLLAIGRNQSENNRLESLALSSDYLIKVADRPGPLGLLRPIANDRPDDFSQFAALVARYSDARNLPSARVYIYHKDDQERTEMEIVPLSPDQVPASV